MILNGIELCEQIQQHFQADTSLSYIETCEIQLWQKDDFPDFDKYCLVISPDALSFNLKAQQMMQETFYPEIICIVRKYDPVKALLGTTVPDIGIIKMVYDTWKSLFSFYHQNRDLDYRYDEIEERISINSHQSGENIDFYYWVSISNKIRFKEFRFQEV